MASVGLLDSKDSGLLGRWTSTALGSLTSMALEGGEVEELGSSETEEMGSRLQAHPSVPNCLRYRLRCRLWVKCAKKLLSLMR